VNAMRSPRHGYVEGVGRVRLHYRAWDAEVPRAGVLLVHGLFENSRRYEQLGDFMVRAGFSVFALDLRGHGASEGRRGHVRRFEILLQDLDRFRREVTGILPPGTPLFLIGHSLGGLIGLRYLEEYETSMAGAVITSPWLGTAVQVPRWQVLMARVLDRVMPAFPFPFRLDARTLTHDPERVTDYQDDATIHTTITPRLFTEISSAIHLALQRGDRIDVPVHFILAGDDRIVDTARSLAFARALPERHVTVEVLDGLYHEVLQETNRLDVLARIRDWLSERLPQTLPDRQDTPASALHDRHLDP
jgi:alpha-beta hydrolase superfamily lysophospholipase